MNANVLGLCVDCNDLEGIDKVTDWWTLNPQSIWVISWVIGWTINFERPP